MERIVHITNFEPRESITDGGTNREEALARIAAGMGARRLVVQDSGFKASKTDRFLRLHRLMKEIQEIGPELILLNYPSYPFFWQHKVTHYYWFSILFARRLRQWASNNRVRIVVDVMDMPLYQHRDLGYGIEMSDSRFRVLDRAVFQNADHIWFCSSRIRELAIREYGLRPEATSVVANGSSLYTFSSKPRDERPFRFVYCGSLARERGIGEMIEAYDQARIPNSELHLAGEAGEWIKQQWNSTNIIYHGKLTDPEAAELASNCNLGLIYYPQHGYYQLAYATKLPFYVCAGVPVLCTNVQETGIAVSELGVGRVVDISRFGAAMAELVEQKHVLQSCRESLERAREKLTWDRLYTAAIERLEGADVE